MRKHWLTIIERIDKEIESGVDFTEYAPEWNSLEKWFSDEAKRELSIIKKVLTEYKFDDEAVYEFFLIGFSSIIRRVSTAYDGEVRPHVNKSKKSRSPISAFSKKITEMIKLADEFNVALKKSVESRTFLQNNENLGDNTSISNAGINLVLSHPPYLNCFDYIPVYSLELRWTESIKQIWGDMALRDVQNMETKSWPATSDKILYGYFDGLKKAYSEVFRVLKKGGVCGVVIGDSTIRGELIRVHKILSAILVDIGFEPIEVIYRTTHYGIGKYAYNHRADYHGKQDDKLDGIVIFRKP